MHDIIKLEKKLCDQIWRWFELKGVHFLSAHLNGMYENVDHILSRIGNRLRSLTVEFYAGKDGKNDLLALNHCCKLTTLKFLSSGRLTDAWIIVDVAPQILSNLEHILFSDCINVNDRACEHLARHCPLKSFVMEWDLTQYFTDELFVDNSTAISLLAVNSLEIFKVDLTCVTMKLINQIRYHPHLINVDIRINIKGRNSVELCRCWNIDIASFRNMIETCCTLETFLITTPMRRVIFEYIKGQRICLTKCSTENFENISLVAFFERHRLFNSVCLRNFDSMLENVIDVIAKNIPDIITLQLHNCGTKYKVSTMCRFIKCCPRAENFSFVDCDFKLRGVNRFTESVHPVDQGHINVVFVTGGEDSHKKPFYAWEDFRLFPCLIERGDVDSENYHNNDFPNLPLTILEFNNHKDRRFIENLRRV
jgi:hypothetical protein